jgi:vacuolar-type H+-ATPase subunit F/Vma7
MSICVVGDAPLVEAFELAGIPGHVPKAGQEVGELLTELARGGGVQLLLIQTCLAESLAEVLVDQLARKHSCLVLAIPGVNEASPDPTTFVRTVQSAIGAVR